jgi:hypothetical protein
MRCLISPAMVDGPSVHTRLLYPERHLHIFSEKAVVEQVVLIEKAAHLLLRAIAGAIVDHNHFHAGIRAGNHRLERGNQPDFLVIGGDNDRDQRLVGADGAQLL